MFNAINFILPIDPVVVPAGVVRMVSCSSTVSFTTRFFVSNALLLRRCLIHINIIMLQNLCHLIKTDTLVFAHLFKISPSTFG